MVKRTKRNNRGQQKGGIFGFFEEEKNGINNYSNPDSGFMSNLTGFFTSSPPASTDASYTPASSYTSSPPASDSYLGGRRRTKHMRGGSGYSRLGLSYYATPVNDIKVGEPTYMEYYKGGRRHKSRKCRKTCRKSHRHCRK
jgi:hypothetical protein